MDISIQILENYLVNKALVLIPVCYILGTAIKKSEKIDDKYIPILLIFLSITLSLFLLGLNIDSVIQGILAAGGAVLCNNLKKQSKK